MTLVAQLARLLDWLDDRVWRHRTHQLCVWIAEHYPGEPSVQ